jgi:hypothetical protein
MEVEGEDGAGLEIGDKGLGAYDIRVRFHLSSAL